MRSRLFSIAAGFAAVIALGAGAAFAQQEAAKPTPSYTEPPETTLVSARLMLSDNTPMPPGVAYFVFQSRLNEIPHTNPLEKVKAISETSVAVDEGGSFTLKMKPGNFALVYVPGVSAPGIGEPGPESMAVMKKLTREQVDARIAAIKENAAKGLPIQAGRIGEAYILENRYVRPPVSDFGEVALDQDASILVVATNEAGAALDIPAILRLRGKNGDIYEPHNPSISAPGRFTFHDVMPQDYQVIAIGSRPRPGAGDEVTTPSIKNSQFVFTGQPLEHAITVSPGKPGDAAADAPPPTPPPAAPNE